MDTPKEILDAIREIVTRYAPDLERQKSEACKYLRRLARQKPRFVEALLDDEAISLVYDARSKMNREVNRANGTGHSTPKVRRGQSPAVRTAASRAEAVLDLFAGGKTLRDILGRELPEFAARERAIARGHLAKAALLEALAAHVPPELSVGQAVAAGRLSVRRLLAVYDRVRAEYGDDAT